MSSGIPNAEQFRLREKIDERLAEHPVMLVQNLEFAMNRFFRNKVSRDDLPTRQFIEFLSRNKYHTDGESVSADPGLISSSSHGKPPSPTAVSPPAPAPRPAPAPPADHTILQSVVGTTHDHSAPVTMQPPEHEAPVPSTVRQSPPSAPVPPKPTAEELASTPGWMKRRSPAEHTTHPSPPQDVPQEQRAGSPPSPPEGQPAPARSSTASLLDQMRSLVTASETKRVDRSNFMTLLPAMSGHVAQQTLPQNGPPHPPTSPSPSAARSDASLARTPPEFDANKGTQSVRFGVAAETWTSQQVCSWVLQTGFGQWLKPFREHEIDGYELLRLTSTDLRAEFGITTLQVRKNLLDAIARLRGYENSAALKEASKDTEEDMQLLCESERLALAELQRLEEVLHKCQNGDGKADTVEAQQAS